MGRGAGGRGQRRRDGRPTSRRSRSSTAIRPGRARGTATTSTCRAGSRRRSRSSRPRTRSEALLREVREGSAQGHMVIPRTPSEKMERTSSMRWTTSWAPAPVRGRPPGRSVRRRDSQQHGAAEEVRRVGKGTTATRSNPSRKPGSSAGLRLLSHRPAPGVEAAQYEAVLREFHQTLAAAPRADSSAR